jgi:hypothetical protein
MVHCKAMQNKSVSRFSCFANFNNNRFSKCEFETKQNRGSVFENFLQNSNVNNHETKVQNHGTKIIVLLIKIWKYQK